jgi:galactokinase
VNRSDAVAGFQSVFRRDPQWICRAPGRVNLIGEHTDYNEGLVFPAAIDFAIWTAIASRSDRTLRAFAGDRHEEVTIDMDAPGAGLQTHWSDYVRGITAELAQEGHRLAGADLWFAGDIPGNAGLSSSAALEVSIGLALLANSGIRINRLKLALAGQRAEHHFAGTRCGIMDQFVSAHGRAGHALLLDCRSLEYRLLAIPRTLSLIICDTGVRHELATGEYNQRRAQCEEGVRHLKTHLPEIQSLRDVTAEHLQIHGSGLPALIQRRCRHVISENLRVEQFAFALEKSDLPAIRRLMAESHSSLRDDFEVSCPELDLMVQLAENAPGVVGTRMTGGGFGGCTVNLVEGSRVDEFRAHVAARYAATTGVRPRIFVTSAAHGAAIVPE